ncbi:small multidrug efflux transporter [Bacillus velezensis UCMB5036]|jgi:multidrug resistance protein EbrB|uniref:Small multidrug resistance protein, SMR family n=3 Tax=Bacillus velezensis TaxID=492670 RepID=I2C5G2_BACAY|nr:small multidrug resistance protein, SMR family [Bacillus velezensis YAU B9601-Y2]AGZ56458.1 small multidrug resistance protein, SMR family [Bacillus amyloliquefaciens CC178]AJK65494.1 small multidrug resistance efflux transporter [Bacillus amyloliquefaciens KHG19]AKL76331.1 small multidrug efflux transporter [Bacillus velezensis]QEY91760.1 Multidrug resistance protein EbrB [Bacillus amyloliquefaciens]CCP21696.1 small multidrug efflux transporter [Bacillus velezensis UCMB5036]CDG25965.1 sma
MLMKGLLCLALAIVSEVFGSTMLKLSDGFTHLWPALGVIAGIGASFMFLSFSLKSLDLSAAYATWSGVGTALTAIVGFFVFKEAMTVKMMIGLVLVITGVILLNRSKSQKAKKNQTARS